MKTTLAKLTVLAAVTPLSLAAWQCSTLLDFRGSQADYVVHGAPLTGNTITPKTPDANHETNWAQVSKGFTFDISGYPMETTFVRMDGVSQSSVTVTGLGDPQIFKVERSPWSDYVKEFSFSLTVPPQSIILKPAPAQPSFGIAHMEICHFVVSSVTLPQMMAPTSVVLATQTTTRSNTTHEHTTSTLPGSGYNTSRTINVITEVVTAYENYTTSYHTVNVADITWTTPVATEVSDYTTEADPTTGLLDTVTSYTATNYEETVAPSTTTTSTTTLTVTPTVTRTQTVTVDA